jgi:hypothetical protein
MTRCTALGDRLAAEANRYLDVVERFAAFGADPHAEARAKAEQARARERTAHRSSTSWTRRRLRR